MKKKVIVTFVIASLLLFSTVSTISTLKGDDYFFKLKIIAIGGDPNYISWVMDYLGPIKIDTDGYVEVSMYDWLGYLKKREDWDMAIFYIREPNSQDMRKYFTEHGRYNIFGLNSEIPYNLGSEVYQFAAMNSTDKEERDQILWSWQILLMDKILPVLPLFSPQYFESIWENTEGYEERWGFSDSLPYVSFNGLHEGQESLIEFNIGKGRWGNVNPLFAYMSSRTSTEKLIVDLVFTPLLQWSPYLEPLKTGIIEDWTKINNNHYSFQIRENIFWNPSYDITSRNSTSDPLSFIPEGELLQGLRGEHSNGTNQQVSAKDAVFTLLAYSNNEISKESDEYEWFSNCYIDSLDDLVFHLILNDDSLVFKEEYYSDFWKFLSVPLLPEFFLNSSNLYNYYTNGNQSYVGLYPEIIDTPEWKIFDKSAFGCGKYMLDYKFQHELTVLQKSPFWFEIGAIDGTTQTCDIKRINIHSFVDVNLIFQEFKEGVLDYFDFFVDDEWREEIQADSRYELLSYPRDYMYFLAFNLDRPYIGGEDNNIWLDEPGKTDYTKALAVRKAICNAINLTHINKKFLDNEYLRNHNPNPYINDFIGLPFPIQYDGNLSVAKEWMEAAGYSFDIITLKANSNIVIAVLCVVLISIFIDKIKLKRIKKMSENGL